MKIKRTAQSILLLIPAVLTVLFLSSFFITCFTGRPVTQAKAQVQPIAAVPEIIQVYTPEAGPELIEVYTPEIGQIEPSQPTVVSTGQVAQKLTVPNENLPLSEEVPNVLPEIEHLIEPAQPPVKEGLPVLEQNSETIEAIKLPDLPSFTGVHARLLLPSAPIFYEPTVYTVDDYDSFIAPMEEVVVQDEEDPFADFFVSGEDSTIAFDNGLYFLGLYVNNEYIGDIEAEFKDGVQSLNVSELALFVGDYITDEAYKRIFSDVPSYIPIEELNKRGVETVFDSTDFTVSMNFSVEAMPIRTISINAGSINRRDAYSLSGAIVLAPAKFSVVTALGFYANYEYDIDFSALDSQLLSLSVSHKLAFWNLGFDVSYSLSSDSPYFSFGSWQGFYDFVETSQRLTFGNVGENLSNINSSSDSYDSVTSVGVSFDKDYSYGTDSAKGNQFEYSIVLVEDSNVSIEINGKEIYNRTFNAGTYRLKDFVFTQGVNMAKVTITPTAHPNDITIKYFDLGYDYRLLGKGDSTYGFSFSVPRVVGSTKVGTISLPWLDDQYLSYFMENWTATYYQQTGLTNSFTFSSDVSITPGIFSGTVSGVYASTIGTTQLQLTLGLDVDDQGPSFSSSLSHRFNVPYDSKFGTLSMGLSYSKSSVLLTSTDDPSRYITGNISYSGNLTKGIRYSVTGSMTKDSDYDAPSWSTTFSTGFSPIKNLSISGSITAAASALDVWNPSITAQVSGSYSFTPKLSGSASSSASFDPLDVVSSFGLAYRPSDNDSFSLSLSGVDFVTTEDQSLQGSWSHTGDYASFTFRQQAYDSYQKMTSTLSANTYIAYADGAFGLAKSVNEAFLLVKPIGELRDAEISVARSLDSSPEYLKRPLGSALYNNITTNTRNSIVVFGSGSSKFGTGTSSVYEINPRSRQAFVATIDVAATYTVSGMLYQADHTPYVQYSSPVYDVSIGPDGNEVLTPDQTLYLFTDIDGRYILSDVNPGNYLFDLEVEGLWYAVRFSVPEPEKGKIGKQRVFVLEDFWVSDPQIQQRLIVRDQTGKQVDAEADVFGTELATGYDASITLNTQRQLDDDTFWSEVFPSFEEVQSVEPEVVVDKPILNVAP
jgi:outer membrane usher protein